MYFCVLDLSFSVTNWEGYNEVFGWNPDYDNKVSLDVFKKKAVSAVLTS